MFKRKLAPVASTYSVRQGQGRQGITVRGRDFVTDIKETGSTGPTYKNSFFKLVSPTDKSLFAWMSQMAALFETYKFLDLKFVYESQCPSSTAGTVIIYYDPDPTSTAAIDWPNASQRGVNVHGAVWSRHVLSVPQALCSSRREYYVRTQFPAIDLNGAFAYDPLEYFPGTIGVAFEGHSNATQSFGKLYVEYSIVFGKANESAEPASTLAGIRYVAPYFQAGKNAMITRNTSDAQGSANFIILGPGQLETSANGKQAMSGFAVAANLGAGALIANTLVELRFLVTLSSVSTAWTSNPILFGVKPKDASGFSNSSTDVTVNGIQYARRVYDAGVGTTAYMCLFAVRLNEGDALQILCGSQGNNFSTTPGVPGYTVRMYTGAYLAD